MKRLAPHLSLLAAGLLFAATSCQSTHAHEKHEHHGDSKQKHEADEEGDEDEEHEDELPAQPATPLSAAITTAQASVPDGRFLQAEVENEDGKLICSIVLASKGAVREVNIDAASGQLLATEDEPLKDEHKQLLEALAKNPAHAPIGAGQAIEAALAKVPKAWVLAAELDEEDGAIVYQVVLVDGKVLKLAEVGALDGKLNRIGVAEQDEDEGDEGSEAKEHEQRKEHEHEAKH